MWMENAVYGRRKDAVAESGKGVDSAPENHAVREDTGSADTEPSENHAAREYPASSVASGEPSVIEIVATPQKQARGAFVKPSLPEKVKSSDVAVDRAAAATAVRKEKAGNLPDLKDPQAYPDPSVSGTEPSENRAAREDPASSGEPSVLENVATPQKQARGTFVQRSLREKSSAVAVDRAATETAVRKEKTDDLPDLKDPHAYPAIPPADPKRKTAPKPRHQQHR